MALSARTATLRTVVVRVTVSAFSLAALMGVIALLAGGAFGATEGRILLTTLLVGVASVLTLCYLATAGTRVWGVGLAGGVVLVVPVLTALVMIWRDWESEPGELVWKSFGVGAIWAATLAQGSLLLALGVGHRTTPVVRRVLAATLVLAVVLGGLVSALVLGLRPEGGPYPRLVGIVAILDVLGTVVVAALSWFGGGRVPRTAPSRAAGVTGATGATAAAPRPLAVPEPQATALARLADARGATTEALLAEAVDEYLQRAEGGVAPAGGPGIG